MWGLAKKSTELSPAKGSQRRSPIEIKDSQWILNIDLVVEAIGNKAFEDSNKLYPGVDIDAEKLIKASLDDCRTSKQGIFAGGDIVHGPDVIHAIADGHRAAQAIDTYLVNRK